MKVFDNVQVRTSLMPYSLQGFLTRPEITLELQNIPPTAPIHNICTYFMSFGLVESGISQTRFVNSSLQSIAYLFYSSRECVLSAAQQTNGLVFDDYQIFASPLLKTSTPSASMSIPSTYQNSMNDGQYSKPMNYPPAADRTSRGNHPLHRGGGNRGRGGYGRNRQNDRGGYDGHNSQSDQNTAFSQSSSFPPTNNGDGRKSMNRSDPIGMNQKNGYIQDSQYQQQPQPYQQQSNVMNKNGLHIEMFDQSHPLRESEEGLLVQKFGHGYSDYSFKRLFRPFGLIKELYFIDDSTGYDFSL